MVGNEGMFGVNVFPGSVSTPLEAVVQLPGDGLRMRAGALTNEFQAISTGGFQRVRRGRGLRLALAVAVAAGFGLALYFWLGR